MSRVYFLLIVQIINKMDPTFTWIPQTKWVFGLQLSPLKLDKSRFELIRASPMEGADVIWHDMA